MRGHVRKRGNTWAVVYDEGHDETGKRRQRWRSGFATRREAQAFLTDVLSRLGEGSYVQPSKLTLGDYASGEWLPAVESTVRPLTLAGYRQAVKRVQAHEIGARRLQALTGGDVNRFYADLEAAGLAASTRRHAHAVLHRALRDAVRWGRLARNPADMADPPARSRTRAQAWTARELGRFLEHVRGDRLFAFWRLAATTGMRRGELLGLTWRCLDLAGARLSVEQQLVPTRGGATFGPPKSARSRRSIALDAETVEALVQHREAQLLERAFAADAYTDHDLVFADELGRPIHPNPQSGSSSTGRPSASPRGRYTRSDTQRPRSYSRRGSRYTSPPPVSATTRTPCSEPMRTCCRNRTSRRPNESRPSSSRCGSQTDPN